MRSTGDCAREPEGRVQPPGCPRPTKSGEEKGEGRTLAWTLALLAFALTFGAASRSFALPIAVRLPPPPPATASCAFLPPGARPMLEAKPGRNRSPVAVYPLGFSRRGRFAWMELAQGFDSEGYTWLVEIVDLDGDRKLKELTLE